MNAVRTGCWLTIVMFVAAACDRGTPAGGMTSAAPPQARTAAASADWDAFVASYIEDYFTANPVFAVYAGRHEFDGRMQDFSAAALQREIARLRRARAQAAAFDAATLGETAAFERDYLLSQIDGDLFWLAEAQWGRGIVSAAVALVVAHAFDAMGAERVQAYVYDWNPASRRVLEKNGFEQEGRLRRAVYKDGRWGDCWVYGRLR